VEPVFEVESTAVVWMVTILISLIDTTSIDGLVVERGRTDSRQVFGSLLDCD
jgi:hypothetical protein